VHAVFFAHEPHGTVYARISDIVGGLAAKDKIASVPYIVSTPMTVGDMREELNISNGTTVIGRYGSASTFDIPFVQHAVAWISQRRPDIIFLFMNTDGFAPESANVRFLPPSSNAVARAQFVNTCDAMLHSRRHGETFGLAVAEFSLANKPVLTFASSMDLAHVIILGEHALIYHDEQSLKRLLLSFNRSTAGARQWNAYSGYGPKESMKRFIEVFW